MSGSSFTSPGRAAEEVLLDEASSGAGGSSRSDLALATRLALQAVSAYGFDEAGTGLVWAGDPSTADVPAMLAANPVLSERVRDALAQAYSAALAFIDESQDAVQALAEALVEKRSLDGREASLVLVLGECRTKV